jgi:ribosomal protein L7/L12
VDDLDQVVRGVLAGGGSVDDAAREAVRQAPSPIAAIKALRSGLGLSLTDARTAVHRHLDPAAQEAAEAMWEQLLNTARAVRMAGPGRQEDAR